MTYHVGAERSRDPQSSLAPSTGRPLARELVHSSNLEIAARYGARAYNSLRLSVWAPSRTPCLVLFRFERPRLAELPLLLSGRDVDGNPSRGGRCLMCCFFSAYFFNFNHRLGELRIQTFTRLCASVEIPSRGVEFSRIVATRIKGG